MLFRQLFEPDTSTYTYLLADEQTREAVLIDPVREMVERDLKLVKELGLKLVAALDTHAHADHITGSGLLRRLTGCRVVVSKHAHVEGADQEVDDGDAVAFGGLKLEVRATPGHTDGCVTYVTTDRKMAFTGDALLVRKTGRTDFQQGDPKKLFRAIQDKILSLPEETQVYPGHDYQGFTVSTVGEEIRYNERVGGGRTEDEYVKIMNELKLPHPRYLEKALPANMRCGLTEDELAGSKYQVADGPWAPIHRSPTGVPEVTSGFVFESGCHFKLVDVRELDEYNGPLGHVAGSELVPLSMLPDIARHWDRQEKMVLICRSGGRSGMGANLLESMGFANVVSMAGGMIAWNEKGLPVQRLAPGDLSGLRDEVYGCFVALQGGDENRVKPLFLKVFQDNGVNYEHPDVQGLEKVLEGLHRTVVAQGLAEEAANRRLSHFKNLLEKAS